MATNRVSNSSPQGSCTASTIFTAPEEAVPTLCCIFSMLKINKAESRNQVRLQQCAQFVTKYSKSTIIKNTPELSDLGHTKVLMPAFPTQCNPC